MWRAVELLEISPAHSLPTMEMGVGRGNKSPWGWWCLISLQHVFARLHRCAPPQHACGSRTGAYFVEQITREITV